MKNLLVLIIEAVWPARRDGDGPKPSAESPREAGDEGGAIDPFAPGGPFPGARCATCREAEAGWPPEWRRRMVEALTTALRDGEAAEWFAAEIAGGRLCKMRVTRILRRGASVVCCGPPLVEAIRGRPPIEIALARAYVAGELRRLAARSGCPCPIPAPWMVTERGK